MPLSRATRLGGWLLVGLATHLLVVWQLPSLAMHLSYLFVQGRAGGVNRAHHPPPVSHQNNVVVLQNADVLAAWCAYDLRDGPVRFLAQLPPDYWSLSLYDMETNNFFVLNDRQVESAGPRSAPVEVVLDWAARSGPAAPSPSPYRALSPHSRGVALFRYFLRDRDQLEALQAYQREARCEPVSPR